jgi:hypothetical protein
MGFDKYSKNKPLEEMAEEELGTTSVPDATPAIETIVVEESATTNVGEEPMVETEKKEGE